MTIPTSPLQSIDDQTTTNDLPDILAQHKATINGTSIKDSIMFNSFFPLNMNDSIKEEANDTLTREELEFIHDSDDQDDESRLTKEEKDIEDGEIVDEQDNQDGDGDEQEPSSSDDLPKRKQRTSGGSHDDQESCGSDDEYVEESDYQSQSPVYENRSSNISSDQSESPKSP